MPVQEYLAGVLLLSVVLGTAGCAGALVIRRRLDHLDRLERSLALCLLTTAGVVAAHVVPLALGVLSRETVVLTGAILAAGLAAGLRAGGPFGVEPPRAEAPPSGRAPRWLAAAGVVVAATALLARVREHTAGPYLGVDTPTFHLPNVARWIESGSLWQIDQFVPLLAHGNYPQTGDVVLLAIVLPWENDFLARFATTAFLLLAAVTVAALARELGAPWPAAALAAAVVTALPTAVRPSVELAMPDAVLFATFALAILFTARAMRTRRTADLVLGGVALGLALGTKWYGVSAAAVTVLAWAATVVLARDPRRALAGAAAIGATAGAVGGVWLVRNWVQSGNPVFPVRVSPFGLTIFDAPRDVIREQLGFSLADYVLEPGVWGQIAGELFEGTGLALLLLVGALAAALPVRGRPRPDAVRFGVLVVVGCALTYVVTPYTALGTRGDPSLVNANARYLMPAVLVAAALTAAIAGFRRGATPALEAGLLLVLLTTLAVAHENVSVRSAAQAVVLVALVLGTVKAAGARIRLDGRRTRLASGAAATVMVLVVLSAGQLVQSRLNDRRYLGMDPALDALAVAAPSDRRIALAGEWTVDSVVPVYPAFGARLGNEVEYVGPFVDGLLRQHDREGDFRNALREGDFDFLVVGRGLSPPQRVPAAGWARTEGWRVTASSRRLLLLAAPHE